MINYSPRRTVGVSAQIDGDLWAPDTADTKNQLSHENVLVDWSLLGECLLDYDSAA